MSVNSALSPSSRAYWTLAEKLGALRTENLITSEAYEIAVDLIGDLHGKEKALPEVCAGEDRCICLYWPDGVYCEIGPEGSVNIDQIIVEDDKSIHNEHYFPEEELDRAIEHLCGVLETATAVSD